MNELLFEQLVEVVRSHVTEESDTQQLLDVAQTVVEFGHDVSSEMLDEVKERVL